VDLPLLVPKKIGSPASLATMDYSDHSLGTDGWSHPPDGLRERGHDLRNNRFSRNPVR
jgi:hypothetical protein